MPVTKGSVIHYWHMGEVKSLRANYRKLGAEACAIHLGRSTKSVWAMACRCGLADSHARLTAEQKRYVADHCRTMNDVELAAELRVGRYAVRACRRHLGKRYGQGRRATKRVDLVARARLLALHRLGLTDREIAAQMRRARSSVLRMRRQLGLSPNPGRD